MLCIDSTSSIMQSNYDKSGMYRQAANYNTNLLSIVSLSLRSIEGRVQYPTLRVVFIFDKDGISPGTAEAVPGYLYTVS